MVAAAAIALDHGYRPVVLGDAIEGEAREVARIAGDPTLDWDQLRRFVAGEGLEVPVWASLAEVDARLHLGLDVPAARGWRNCWPRRASKTPCGAAKAISSWRP